MGAKRIMPEFVSINMPTSNSMKLIISIITTLLLVKDNMAELIWFGISARVMMRPKVLAPPNSIIIVADVTAASTKAVFSVSHASVY